LGDATKAREALGWEPKVGFKELVRLMVDSDLELARHELEARKTRGEDTSSKVRWGAV